MVDVLAAILIGVYANAIRIIHFDEPWPFISRQVGRRF